MQENTGASYSVSGPKGLPVVGVLIPAIRDDLRFLMQNSRDYGDIIPLNVAGMQVLQANHPDIVHYVLMENHKNYYKSDIYIRFQSALGLGLITSNGEKWRRDRQEIQPMFKREQIEGYYFQIVNEVAEKYKRRWLKLTEKGPARINVTQEMALITIEVILHSIFGKENLNQETLASLHHSYGVFIDYLKTLRLLPKVDMRKLFHTPAYVRYHKELVKVEALLKQLVEKYRSGAATDKYNMLALLLEAQKEDPEHFSEEDLRDHTVTMVFAGYETTSILMQWMWYVLDGRPDIVDKLRSEMAHHAPAALAMDSSGLTYDAVNRLEYLGMVIKETMRLYPPFWGTSRAAVENDHWGDFKVKRGTNVALPQLVMHRHPRWWHEPNAFIPERFTPENEAKLHPGLYFPFSHGPRKCIGHKFVEMEAKTVFAKLLPSFKATVLNVVENRINAGISLKLKQPLQMEICRI